MQDLRSLTKFAKILFPGKVLSEVPGGPELWGTLPHLLQDGAGSVPSGAPTMPSLAPSNTEPLHLEALPTSS